MQYYATAYINFYFISILPIVFSFWSSLTPHFCSPLELSYFNSLYTQI